MASKTHHLQQVMSCSKIPSLPDTKRKDKIRENHHKPQRFKVQNGGLIETEMKPPLDKSLTVSPHAGLGELYDRKQELLKEWEALEQQVVLKKQQHLAPINSNMNSSKSMPSLRVPPSWLKHDREVLRFYMYFKEAVHESAQENHRVRRCTLLYYLADNTMKIEEPKEENSGLPQGVFLNRAAFTKANGESYKPEDFLIGSETTIFGRTFRVVDYDEKTRLYLAEQGFQNQAAEEYPMDPHRQRLLDASEAARNPPVVASLAGAKKADTLGKYLKNDNKVLRFRCLWDDTERLYGERNHYELSYFLSDDTIEIRSVGNRDGMDPNPVLLKKSKLIKCMDDPSQGFYTAADLECGKHINCWGRKLMLLKCSDYTQKYYERVHGIKQAVVKIKQPPRKIIKKVIPPYNGFGSEADSLANCLNLVPKPVCQDLHRFLNNRGKKLRFWAKFTDPAPEDTGRKFLITYFMDDDTCAVYEPPIRNSGIVGGKFLERGKYKKPIREKKKANRDLNLLKATILEKIQSRMVGGPYVLLRAFRKFGTDENGCITFENFKIGLRDIGILPTAFSDDLLKRLFTVYDNSGDMKIDYQEFVDQVMMDKPIAANETRFISRWLRGSDFFVGTNITFMFPQTGAVTQEFTITSADKSTLDLMAQHPDDFPKSNVEAIASMLAETLSENHVNIGDAFKVIDQTNKGWIYPEQFGQLLKHWALDFGLIGEELTEHETLTLVRHYDKDGDGKIFYNEFYDALLKKKPVGEVAKKDGFTVDEAAIALFERLQPLQEVDGLLEMFQSIDEDGSGKICWVEFSNMLKQFDIVLNDSKDRHHLMMRFDRNMDGLIDYKEFSESLGTMEQTIEDNGRTKKTLVPKKPNSLKDFNQVQHEMSQKNILEYQSILEVASKKESEYTQLRNIMQQFVAKFLSRKKKLMKEFASYDIDNTGYVTFGECSEALTKTNPDFSRYDKIRLLDYIFKNSSELEYGKFLDTMFSQDINKALISYGHLKTYDEDGRAVE